MLPILAFVAAGEIGARAPRARSDARRRGRSASRSRSQAAAVLVRGGPLARSDFLEHSWAARLVLDHRPSLYRPAPEVFVERTLHHEGAFEGPVVYRDASGRCRKAWLQWRHAEALVAACGEPPGPAGAHACGRTPGSARRSATGRTSTTEPGPRQAPHLLRPQLPPLARRQLAEVEPPDAHAHELEDLVPDRGAHPPDLTVLALGEDDLEPGRALALRPGRGQGPARGTEDAHLRRPRERPVVERAGPRAGPAAPRRPGRRATRAWYVFGTWCSGTVRRSPRRWSFVRMRRPEVSRSSRPTGKTHPGGPRRRGASRPTSPRAS